MHAAAEAARDAGEAAASTLDAAPGLPVDEIADSEQAPTSPTAAAAAPAAAAPSPAAEPAGSPQQTSRIDPGATSITDSAQAASPAATEPASPPVADYDAGSAVDAQPEPEFPEQPAVPPDGGGGSTAQPGRGFALGAVPVDTSQFMRLRYLVMMREEGSGRAVAVSLQGGEEAVLAFEVGRGSASVRQSSSPLSLSYSSLDSSVRCARPVDDGMMRQLRPQIPGIAASATQMRQA